MKVSIYKNNKTSSLDIWDPLLGYDIPLMPNGIVISPTAVEAKLWIRHRVKLDKIENFDECLGSLHQARPHVLQPESVGEAVTDWLKEEWNVNDAYVRFTGREHKVYIDFGLNFNKQQEFLMFLNEKKFEMRYLRFIESKGQIEVEPLEELCLLAFLR